MRRLVFGGVIVAAIVLPWIIGSRYVFHIATMITIIVPMALSVNLALKLDQLSLAQPAFMGIGAYTAALLTMRLGMSPAFALLLGGGLATVVALVCGPVFLRIKGVYFVLLTYAFGQIINLIFQEWTSLLGGNNGLYGIPKFSILGWTLTTTEQYYTLGLFFALLFYGATRAIEKSDIGAIFQSLNEDEMLACSIGSNAHAWRIAAFVFGAFMAGVSGAVYAFYLSTISPEVFGFQTIIDLIVINVVGGPASALGPVIGAIVVVPLLELLREAREYQLLIYGICLIIVLVFFKQGLASLLVRRRTV